MKTLNDKKGSQKLKVIYSHLVSNTITVSSNVGIGLNMKLRIQTLTGQIGEVEADPENTILDLKVRINSLSGSREEWPKQTLI